MSWTEAGEAWGARAADWAALLDPWTLPVYLDVFDRLAVRHGDHTLDVACGSGLAAAELHRRGASVSGLDASSPLIAIASLRTPDGDFRVGDMFELPWGADTFDIVTSFNGIFGGGEAALAEVRRVLRPGGRVGIGFWGDLERMDIVSSFVTALMELSPPEEMEAGAGLLAISQPGAAESMAEEAGLQPIERGTTTSGQDFADLDCAVRAFSATGPAWAAIQHAGAERWRARLTELFEPFVTASGLVRLVNEAGWLIAQG